jgi:cystathionine beta-lyase
MNNYDTTPDRRGTGSIKWDQKPHESAPEQIPLWVADMDFPTPEAVTKAIAERNSHPIFGYTMAGDGYYRELDRWFSRRFDFSIEKESVTISPGIVPAIHAAIRAFTEPGDNVIIQNPVYYPFASAVTDNGRNLMVNNLVERHGYYTMNLQELEEMAASAKLMILCSPHNPVGRVWDPGELEDVARIAEKHKLIVVSDEIHCDLVMPDAPRRHTPFPLLDEGVAEQTVLCTAPSKTFNIPGLATSNIVITDSRLRKRFREELKRSCGDLPNCFGAVACEAAYREGEAWLEETLKYIMGNRDALTLFLKENIPDITVMPLEATYLLWLDVRPILAKSSLTSSQLERLFIDEAGVWLESGSLFGTSGEGFLRANIACSRTLLLQAFEKVAAVLQA